MKGLGRSAVLASCVILGLPALLPGAPPAIEWSRDLNRALERARAEGKPVLLDFWATWCRPCRDMEVELWVRPEAVALSRKFVCVRIDLDNAGGVAQRYRVEGIPVVVITDPWGTEIARREGFGGPEEYLAVLKGTPGDFAALAPWHARLVRDRNDLEALREMGRLYNRMGLFHTSREFLERAAKTKDARSRPDVRADILTAIGWDYLKAGDTRQAKKTFQRCLEEHPDHPAVEVTLYGLLSSCRVAGSQPEAQAALARLEACCPASPLLARARLEIGTLARGAD
jgi:thioredoxin-like negative regulator of GroEL